MSKVIVVDTRSQFVSDMTQYCRSFGTDVIAVTDPSQFNEHTFALNQVIVLLWAQYPDVNGINIPKALMRAIAASRRPIPMVLYASHKEAFAQVLEPGMFYPNSIVSEHACTVAGIAKRVMGHMTTRQRLINAFEDWAFQTRASIAGAPGRVSVFSSNAQGGFDTLEGPLDPFKAIGVLCQSPFCRNGRDVTFY